MPAAKSAAATKKNLVGKLAEIMGLLNEALPKDQFNKQQKYAFVGESTISNAVRPLLAERGIWLWSNEVERESYPLYETSSGLTMWLTRLTIEYRFIDGETGEMTEPQKYSGQGADVGDKSLPKAQSMALKYFLLKTFMLSTGKDDAESDEKVDKEAAAKGAKKGAKVSGKASSTAQRGGKTDGITSAQKKAITNLVKEKQFNRTTFAIALIEALEIEVPEDANLTEIVAGLTSEQAGKVIQFLNDQPGAEESEMTDAEADKAAASDAAEAEQETMSVV